MFCQKNSEQSPSGVHGQSEQSMQSIWNTRGTVKTSYYSLIMRCKTQLYSGFPLCNFLHLFWLISVCAVNIYCSKFTLIEVWMFLCCHDVNIESLRTVRSDVTCLPTSVVHYGIWASSLSHINIHHIGVSWWSWCESSRWSHSCHLGWNRVYRLGSPCNRVVMGSTSSDGSGVSGLQGQLEHRVCNATFITEDCSIIPILGDIIGKVNHRWDRQCSSVWQSSTHVRISAQYLHLQYTLHDSLTHKIHQHTCQQNRSLDGT